MRICTAGPGDIDRLIDIGRRSYCDHYRTIWSETGLARYLAAQFDPDMLGRHLRDPSRVSYLLAGAGDEMVGFARINWRSVEPVTDCVGAELQKIYFVRTAVGRGFGSAMLDRIVALARERNEPCIWLDVLADNAAARRFYARHGFIDRGALPFATDLREIGMRVMRRGLGPGES